MQTRPKCIFLYSLFYPIPATSSPFPACLALLANIDYWLYLLPLGGVSHPQKKLQYSWERGEFFLSLSLKSLWAAVLLKRPCQGWGCISHTHVALKHFWIDASEQKNSTQNTEWKLRGCKSYGIVRIVGMCIRSEFSLFILLHFKSVCSSTYAKCHDPANR